MSVIFQILELLTLAVYTTSFLLRCRAPTIIHLYNNCQGNPTTTQRKLMKALTVPLVHKNGKSTTKTSTQLLTQLKIFRLCLRGSFFYSYLLKIQNTSISIEDLSQTVFFDNFCTNRKIQEYHNKYAFLRSSIFFDKHFRFANGIGVKRG